MIVQVYWFQLDWFGGSWNQIYVKNLQHMYILLSWHKQPTCKQPHICRHTQYCAWPCLRVLLSLEQCWQSSLHNIHSLSWHPRLCFHCPTSCFNGPCSCLMVLAHASTVLACASTVLGCASPICKRALTFLVSGWRYSLVFQQSSLEPLSQSSLVPCPSIAQFGGGTLGPRNAEKNMVFF